MHWLYFGNETPALLERAGYAYDSTSGYNEAVGFRAGTSQVFKPAGVTHLLELPMHIQDTALFYPDRMNLSESEAWTRCMDVITQCRNAGGVITVSWHDRSLAPERLWDAFYDRLLSELDSASTWFATARDAVAWFRKRRQIRFAHASREDRQITIELEQVPAEDRHDCSVRLSWQDDSGTVSSVEQPLKGRSELVLVVPAAPAIVR
jgi:hypothetical protein